MKSFNDFITERIDDTPKYQGRNTLDIVAKEKSPYAAYPKFYKSKERSPYYQDRHSQQVYLLLPSVPIKEAGEWVVRAMPVKWIEGNFIPTGPETNVSLTDLQSFSELPPDIPKK